MRIEHLIWAKATEDSAGKDGLWTPDQTINTEVITNMTRLISGVFSVAKATNEDLAFGDITLPAYAIYIEADGDFTATFNGGAETFAFKRADTTTGRKVRCWMEAQITAINIANADLTTAITGRYMIYGDPTS